MSKELYIMQLEDNVFKEKLISIFINDIKSIIERCANSDYSDMDKCNNVAFSILKLFDGENNNLLPCKINLSLDIFKFRNQRFDARIFEKTLDVIGMLNSLTLILKLMKSKQNIIIFNDNINLHKIYQSQPNNKVFNTDFLSETELAMNKLSICTKLVNIIKLIVEENYIRTDSIFTKCNDIAFSILSLIDGSLIQFPTKIYLSINTSDITNYKGSSYDIKLNDIVNLHDLYYLSLDDKWFKINEAIKIDEIKSIKSLVKIKNGGKNK